jgi:putative DNA primase/helicase
MNDPPSRAQAERWYEDGRTGLGLVTGKVSGGLEMLEFETREAWDAYQQRAADVGIGGLLERVVVGYCEYTPAGGVHLFYRCSEICGNTRLACDASGKVLIETRGEGGYAIVAPSYGSVHPSGKPYVLVSGGFDQLVEITPEERDDLWALARSFDRTPPAKRRRFQEPS